MKSENTKLNRKLKEELQKYVDLKNNYNQQVKIVESKVLELLNCFSIYC